VWQGGGEECLGGGKGGRAARVLGEYVGEVGLVSDTRVG
jgi:hypothetical protein